MSSGSMTPMKDPYHKNFKEAPTEEYDKERSGAKRNRLSKGRVFLHQSSFANVGERVW